MDWDDGRYSEILQAVIDILNDEYYSGYWTAGNWQERDNLIANIGPAMTVLHWRDIVVLQRIPRSSEGKTITLQTAHDICRQREKKMNIVFFSHKWTRPSLDPSIAHPDDADGSKAKAMVKLAEYNLRVYGSETFYFVDYSCINQDAPACGVAMLPLYVMACDGTEAGLTCYDSAGYDARAWTQVERALWAAAHSPRQWLYFPDSGRGQQAFWATLKDPRNGELTVESDRIFIRDLADVCEQLWGKYWDTTQDYESWGVNRSQLTLNRTKVCAWAMDQYTR